MNYKFYKVQNILNKQHQLYSYNNQLDTMYNYQNYHNLDIILNIENMFRLCLSKSQYYNVHIKLWTFFDILNIKILLLFSYKHFLSLNNSFSSKLSMQTMSIQHICLLYLNNQHRCLMVIEYIDQQGNLNMSRYMDCIMGNLYIYYKHSFQTYNSQVSKLDKLLNQ